MASAPLTHDLQFTRLPLLIANVLAAGVSLIDTLKVFSTASMNVKFLGAMALIKQKTVTGAPLAFMRRNSPPRSIACKQSSNR